MQLKNEFKDIPEAAITDATDMPKSPIGIIQNILIVYIAAHQRYRSALSPENFAMTPFFGRSKFL